MWKGKEKQKLESSLMCRVLVYETERKMCCVLMTHPLENGDLFSSIGRLDTADALVVADCVLVAACPTTF
jgi:hypothetical protein